MSKYILWGFALSFFLVGYIGLSSTNFNLSFFSGGPIEIIVIAAIFLALRMGKSNGKIHRFSSPEEKKESPNKKKNPFRLD